MCSLKWVNRDIWSHWGAFEYVPKLCNCNVQLDLLADCVLTQARQRKEVSKRGEEVGEWRKRIWDGSTQIIQNNWIKYMRWIFDVRDEQTTHRATTITTNLNNTFVQSVSCLLSALHTYSWLWSVKWKALKRQLAILYISHHTNGNRIDKNIK